MDFLRVVAGVGVTLFMLVAPHIGLPYMQAIPITGGDDALLRGEGRDGSQTLARLGVEVGPRVPLMTLDAGGNRTALRVLWVELDGSKLDRAGQGQGKVPKLVAALATPGGLALGNDTLPLRPGDEVRIEGFEGKWAYAPDGMVGVLRMEGTVLAARVGEKGLRPLGTQEHSVVPGWALSGQQGFGGNVSVKAGRATFVSTEATVGDEVVKHVKARDVRFNGAKVQGTKWGEGPLDSVTFVSTGPGLLRGEDGARSLQAGQRVDVTDFVGGYVVFFAGPDDARIALEGYAREVAFALAADGSPLGSNRPPIAGFDFAPTQPRAGQAVKFWDRSTDLDGRVAHREWIFGDGQRSSEANPSRAFDKAGTYLVTLVATDNSLVSSSVSRNVTVLGVPPEAKWQATPASPSSLDTVQFADASTDLDGRIVAWAWDFGDGQRSAAQHPAHRFADNGRYTVSLQVWDDDGQTATHANALEVRNLAPQARFTWLPADPLSGQAVQFRDASLDQDGTIASWRWDFGDGASSEAQHPTHAFRGKGPQKVTLTVRDDDGAQHAWDSLVEVRNRPPQADFATDPIVATEGQPVRFLDRSSDPDGRVVERVWSFGDGSISTHDGPTHTYLTGGNLTLSLTVKDDDGARSTAVKVLHVNRRPIPAFSVTPVQPTTQEDARFTDASVDPDGRVAAWAWEFGDGNTSAERHPAHRYARTGAYTVQLTITDHEGGQASLRRLLNVSNAVPRANFLVAPLVPTTNRDATFTDASTDPDGRVVAWAWAFGDGASGSGSTVSHRYARSGSYPVTLTVTDDDGHQATAVQVVRVNVAPIAAFTMSPGNPSTTTDVRYADGSSDPDGSIAAWAWDFGDGHRSSERHPVHRYASQGLYTVQLTVTDNDGGTTTLAKPLVVGSLAPTAAFAMAPEKPVAGEAVQFTDASVDPDGRIVAWAWDFGDGQRSAVQHPAHAYAGTGIFPVRLTVTDDAGKTASVEKPLRVYSAGPLEVFLRVVYPDGQPFDLTREGVSIELRESASGARLAKGSGLQVGPDGVARGSFPQGMWASGDDAVATVRMPSAQVDQTRSLPLGNGDLGTLVLRMPLQGRIALAPPRAGEGHYHDPTEQVRGHVVVAWKDGTPVRGAQVTLEYTWEQLGTYSYPVPSPFGASGPTDAQGLRAFAVPFDAGLAEGPGSYLPGTHRINARADYVVADGLATWKGPLTFQVDPLGLRGALTRK
jgi:PKD repeat protein